MPASIPPPYLPAVLKLAAGAPRGTVTDLFVLHDDGCALLAGSGACNCSPVVTRGFVLWFRRSKRAGWEMKGTFPTERAAYNAMKGSGDWLALPAGKEP